ncbi:MAG: segregation/condensation protein A [Candidatus Aenigmarchaeota archaeon]|nr:segregation/condensation protein A [Candidatus Aenigmarchaeota archaeon]
MENHGKHVKDQSGFGESKDLLQKGFCTEEKILKLVVRDHSWEQIIFHLIEAEGLDPKDVDLEVLAKSFVEYINKLEELDFHIPAKMVIIAAVLLRMKSDKLGFEKELVMPDVEQKPEPIEKIETMPLNVPLRRQPKRKVSVQELIEALRRIVETKEKKERKFLRMQERIEITEEDITERIDRLYSKIAWILDRMYGSPLPFSKLVGEWKRKNVVKHFVPLLQLAHQGKVDIAQEDFFKEILISRRVKRLNESDENNE